MNERLAALMRAGDIKTLAEMIRRGELSALPREDRTELPRMAALAGNARLLRFLCERCPAISLAADDQGRDALHWAASSGDAETIAFAAETLGLDPLRGDKRGVTALDLAHASGSAAAVDYLESRLGFRLADGYRNPVRRGCYPDPSLVRVGRDYYMVNSSFTLLPGLPISHSRDLVHWHTVGHAMPRLEGSGLEGLPGGYGYWAPDISFDGERFWVVATLRRDKQPFRAQMITSAADPAGPWSPPRFLEVDGIDPSLFTDADGRRYLLVNPGARLAEINAEGEVVSQPEMIYFGSSRVKSEGPHLIRRDGWYYLFQAEGGTGRNHTETAARSRTLRGPYEPCPFNPILGRRDEDAPLWRGGHGKPIMAANGRWYMAYLCARRVDGGSLLGRETALDPITWTADGWPMVNGLKGPSCLQKRPLPVYPVAETPDWLTPRGDLDAFARWDGETLTLRAGAELSATGPVSLIIRRQTEACLRQEAEVDASAMEQGGKAGLAGYYDERSWYLFGLERQAEGFRLAVWEQEGDAFREAASLPWPGAAARLRITGRGVWRTLQACAAGQWRTLATLKAAYLTDEGLTQGKRFTGAMLGLAAVGGGTAVFRGRAETMTEDETHE